VEILVRRFRYVDETIALIPAFVGIKILAADVVQISDLGSLAVVAALLAGGIVASLIADRLAPPHATEEARRRPVGFVNSVVADFQGNPEPAAFGGEVANAGGSPNEGALLAVSSVGRAGPTVPTYAPEAIASAPPRPSPGHR
jgi:hypothetical protein